MGRSIHKDDRERIQEGLSQNGAALPQGRTGNTSNASQKERANDKSVSSNRGGAGASRNDTVAELARIIDGAAAEKPTMTQFVERLENRGVGVVPSIQSSGRLNGFAFRWRGQTIKASDIGREYTPKGLQRRRGLSYHPDRDDSALLRAAERAGFRRPDRADLARERSGDRHREPNDRVRDRISGLSADQEATLAEIGKFRTVNVEDIVRYRYAGNGAAFVQDARILKDVGFAEQRVVRLHRSDREIKVMVLTSKGRNYLRGERKRAAGRQSGQEFYSGFVKPAEVPHDAGIYRMYQVETDRIEKDGGTIRRVVLDYELKRKVYCELNKCTDVSVSEYAARKREIAAQNGLTVVNGKIVFPDLRIEYETRDQEQEKVDLELATAQYKDSEVQQKRAAGLKIYGPDSNPRSPALNDPEIVAGLISF